MSDLLTFGLEPDEVEFFLQDVNEHILGIENSLLRLEQVIDPETLNAMFRAAHTMKAVAGTIGHRRMADLTHVLETLFDRMREGALPPAPALTDTLLSAVDALKALRDEVVTQQPSGMDTGALIHQLEAFITTPETALETVPGARPQSHQHPLTPEQVAQVAEYRAEGRAVFTITVTPQPEAFVPAARLMQAANEARSMGEVLAQVPAQAELVENRHDGYVWLVLATSAGQDEVEARLREIPDLDEVLVSVYEADSDTPVKRSAAAPVLPAAGQNNTVRVGIERLDALMNLIGELVTDRTRLQQLENTLRARHGKDDTVSTLGEMTAHFSRVVDQLQYEVMQARMVPIAHLFNRFPRLVRDQARAAGKQVELVLEGESTELDRSVIEMIGDPIIHLLRNAVDHGVETPEERAAQGKPPTGTLTLAATHEEGHIVVTVRDDGRGLDPARIRQAALAREVMSRDELAQLDDESVIALIFRPGMSTAARVTDISGRGVGLDVVSTNVRKLNGSVVVESRAGQGTQFHVTLPLTLATLQTMLVGVGDEVYAIPLTGIVETVYLSDVQVSTVKNRPVIYWRDQVLPLVVLRRFFAHPRMTHAAESHNREAVVIVSWGRLRAALQVDSLVGKQEIVIKSLSPLLGSIPAISGCAILGNGRVVLIVDIPGLINTAMQHSQHNAAPVGRLQVDTV